MSGIGEEYTCAQCEKTFIKAWSDEEAKEEYNNSPMKVEPVEEAAIICDDCYKEICRDRLKRYKVEES